MQLRSKMIQHFDSAQIFLHTSEWCERFFEDKYEPPRYGSIFFRIPEDIEKEERYSQYEKEVARILVEHGGATYGDIVCLDFDY